MVEREVSWDQEPIMAFPSPVGHLCTFSSDDRQVKWGERQQQIDSFCSLNPGAVATGEDPTSVAIASIQSSATFPDPNVKYVFRAENGGQVKEGRCCRCYLGGIEGGHGACHLETWLGRC